MELPKFLLPKSGGPSGAGSRPDLAFLPLLTLRLTPSAGESNYERHTAMTSKNTAIDITTSLYRAYNNRNLDDWVSHFSDSAVWLNVPTQERYLGLEGQKKNYAAWNTPFPHGLCKDIVIRGGDNFSVAEFNGVGVHEGPLATPSGEIAPTLKSTSVPFCDVHTIVDGKVAETHRYWDLEDAARQLGL